MDANLQEISEITRPKIIMKAAKKVVVSTGFNHMSILPKSELKELIEKEREIENTRLQNLSLYDPATHISLLAKLIAQAVLLKEKSLKI